MTTRGKTFVRERRQTLEIVSPVVLDVTAKPGDPIAEISLQPVAGAIDPATLRSTAELTGPDGQSRSVDLQKGEDDTWRARLDLGSLEGDLSLRVALTGSTPEGQELDLTLDPITLQGQAQHAAEEPEPSAEVPAAAPEVQTQSETVVEETTENDWIFQAILFGTGNLLLTLFGGAVFWFVRRRRAGNEIHWLEDGEAAV